VAAVAACSEEVNHGSVSIRVTPWLVNPLRDPGTLIRRYRCVGERILLVGQAPGSNRGSRLLVRRGLLGGVAPGTLESISCAAGGRGLRDAYRAFVLDWLDNRLRSTGGEAFAPATVQQDQAALNESRSEQVGRNRRGSSDVSSLAEGCM